MDNNMSSNKELYDFFKSLDRSAFMNDEYKEYAHYDKPFPIGFKQTISQPTLVYKMTEWLDVSKTSKVLEIGTGSGYQTVLLAEFAAEVYSVERIAELSEKAQRRISEMGYENVRFKIGDGSQGWKEYAPYDRIMVTAAAGEMPQLLVEQLKPEGKMIVPVGKEHVQDLLLIRKDKEGSIDVESLGDVVFVELKGKYGKRN